MKDHSDAAGTADSATSSRSRFGNCFLDALSQADAERLLAEATHMDLPVATLLFPRGERPRYAYLLTAGMASVLYTSPHGNSVELAMMGDEAPVGWIFVLGQLHSTAECTMQVSGSGFRMPLASLQRYFDEVSGIRRRLLEVAQQSLLTSYQIAACNRLHRAGSRFARWLLMAADRSRQTELDFTQEFLSDMLGTRRTTVAQEAGALQKAGAIVYSRGHVRILNRKILESRACECYPTIHAQIDRMFQER